MDGNLQRKLVRAIHPGPDDEILEIGPGRGALTQHLAGTCRHLFLVELDWELAAALEAEYGRLRGVRVLQADILQIRLGELTPTPAGMKVVGNIPYNITTPILFHLLQRPRPGEILLMVQKEVGDRILARPGSSEFGALTVGVRTVATVERVLRVPASAFRPKPRVESVVLRVVPIRPEPLTVQEEEDLRTLTRSAFQRRRKQFQNTLRSHPDLGLKRRQVEALAEVTGFDLTARPEEFSPEEFVLLSRALAEVR